MGHAHHGPPGDQAGERNHSGAGAVHLCTGHPEQIGAAMPGLERIGRRLEPARDCHGRVQRPLEPGVNGTEVAWHGGQRERQRYQYKSEHPHRHAAKSRHPARHRPPPTREPVDSAALVDDCAKIGE
jgi:hypothetical protein